MRLVLLVAVGLMVLILAAAAWQHRRYLHVRRDIAQDHQPLLYGSDAFHVVIFLRTAADSDVLEEVRKLRDATRSHADLRWIYAGKVALAGRASDQIGEVDWSAVVLLQLPSRSAYDAVASSETYRQALARFPETYSHGFVRPVPLNLALPQALLARRALQLVRREPSNFPFERHPDPEPEWTEAAERLLAERELGARAAVVFNLIKRGTPEQQAADRGYAGRMLTAMAEGGYGPIHMGRAVRVEADAEFDRVAIVYYPGVQFFADMIRSRFFQGIIGGKQLGDTQATVTVPILDRL